MECLLVACALTFGYGSAAQVEGPARAREPQDPVTTPVASDWLELPDDPLGRLWASVGPGTSPWAYVGSSKAVLDSGPGTPWPAWADAVRASESGDEDVAREARARLLRFACRDGRPRDAFEWLETFGAGDPEAIAGTLPYLFPGVPFDTELEDSGRPPTLYPGVHLRPLCPPSSEDDPGHYIAWREAIASGITIDETTFDLKLKIDGSGVVLDFENVRGGTANAFVTLPVPSGWRMKSVFVDWSKRELPGGADPDSFDWSSMPIEIRLEPRDSTFSIFGRVAPLDVNLPSGPAAGASLPDEIDEAGITLLTLPSDDRPWDAIAKAWSRVLEIHVEANELAADQRPAPVSNELVGIRIDLRRPSAELLRRSLTSIIEGRIRAKDGDG